MKTIHIVIATRDRPEYFTKALASVLAQRPGPFRLEVTVSDNSLGGETEDYIRSQCFDLRYIRRNGLLSPRDHFGAILANLPGDLIVLFHDDDELLPDYCNSVVDAFNARPSAVAVATNAYLINSAGQVLSLVHSHCDDIEIVDPRWLLAQYMPSQQAERGFAPFPSYCYKREMLSIHDMDDYWCGKHSDVSFVTQKLTKGSIVWLRSPLMRYRTHPGQDSAQVSLSDLHLLWRYTAFKGVSRKSSSFVDWRLQCLFGWLVQGREYWRVGARFVPRTNRALVVQCMLRSRANVSTPRRYLLWLIGIFSVRQFQFKKKCKSTLRACSVQ